MDDGNKIRQNRLRCIRSAGQRPSPAPARDIQYEQAVSQRIAIELHFHSEMNKAELQYNAEVLRYRARILWIAASVIVSLILGLSGLGVKLALG